MSSLDRVPEEALPGSHFLTIGCSAGSFCPTGQRKAGSGSEKLIDTYLGLL